MNLDFLNSAIPASYDPIEVIANILVAFTMGFVIALVYQKTHKGLSYSQGFVFSLVLITMITAVVMMVIGNNIAKAFTLVGALSIIRFRTAVKDHKDIAFIFFALVIGMACGTTNYYIAFVSAAAILLAIWVLTNINFGSIVRHEYILQFIFTVGGQTEEGYKAIFEKYLQSSFLLNLNAIEKGKVLDTSYNIKLKDDAALNQFVQELEQVPSLTNIRIISAKHDLDY